MLACLRHKCPHFFWKGSSNEKNTYRLKIQNAQVFWFKNVDSFCLIFFGGGELHQQTIELLKFSRNSMGGNGVLGKTSPDAGSILQETSGKIPHRSLVFSILHQLNLERWPNTKQTKKQHKCHLNLMLLEQWTKIQVVWDIQGIVLLMCQKSGWRSPPGMYKLFFTIVNNGIKELTNLNRYFLNHQWWYFFFNI